MKRKIPASVRFVVPVVLFAAAVVFYFVRSVLLGFSVLPSDKREDGYTVNTVRIYAQRGEIYDRNGNKLVANDYSFDLVLDKNNFPSDSAGINSTLFSLSNALPPENADMFPIVWESGSFLYSYSEDGARKKLDEFRRMCEYYSIPSDGDEDSTIEALCEFYGVTEEQKKDGRALVRVLALRYELDRTSFNVFEPYVYAKGLSFEEAVRVSEQNTCASIVKRAERKYVYGAYMSHILGRVGKIPAESAEYYDELGYPVNATVGVEGAEKAFESYLRGKDGVMTVIRDENGNIVEKYFKEEPVAGKDVYLTIDADLQIAAEDSLKNNILYIRETAENRIAAEKEKNTDENGEIYPWAKIPSLIGEDCRAGAATLISPKTGDVLALASYPSFDITTYLDSYNELLNDEDRPLYNRALLGRYEPGSTFKVGVAAAALQTGLMTKDETIYDKGVYRYYDDWQPRCWIYSSYGYTHGYVNVTSAIQNSCNYYFYDVGRRLTIQTMNEYSRAYGLGEKTGIELPESTGVLAGPEYSTSVGRTWMPGDTLQAAIGQSDNLFSPLQLSVYLSTVLNGGQRYSAHLLYEVREFGTGNVVYKYEPKVVSSIEIAPEHVETLKNAMRRVTENGTASPVFSRYPVEIGGKTGTAQVVKGKSNNGIFVAFAPYDEPEIVVSCVIEQAGGANDVAMTLKGIFNKYFNIDG